MSSIATPRRTEVRHLIPGVSKRMAANAICMLLFALVLISLQPFTPNSPVAQANTGGNIVNQVGFGLMGGLSIFAMMCFADRRVLMSLVGPGWLLLMVLLAFSVLNSADPGAALRAAIFTLIGVMVMCTILVVPRDADDFSLVFAGAALAVIGLSYAGLILLPDLAKHTAAEIESVHAGLWRGSFQHKNVAAPTMACLSFGGLYLLRRGWRWTGGVIFALALFFLAHTGSKTTLALVPAAMLVVALPNLMGMRLVTLALYVVVFVLASLLTIGTAFIGPLSDFAVTHYSDPTFTGRTAIWHFGAEALMRHPWTGFGLESFWGTEAASGQPLSFDADWDVRSIVHGHDGYLDIAIAMGLPALIVFLLVCIAKPAIDYMRVPLTRENVLLADFFMMVFLFTSLNAFLESFFFRRADPVWLFFIFGVFGLRLVAKFRIRGSVN